MPITCRLITESGNVPCPHNLDVCCGVCDHRNTCHCVCDDADNPAQCPDAVNTEVVPFASAVPDTIQKIADLVRVKKELEAQEKNLKLELVKAMEAFNVKVFENDLIKMVYVAPTTRATIDSARLKKDHPDIVKQYTKTSDVSASVRVALK